MNTTKIAQLAFAAALAGGTVLGTAATAHAEDGPVIVLPPPPGDPKPMDIAQPTPTPDPQDGPKDKAPAPKPGPQDGPKDKAPKPKPKPTGPGDLANPKPCPTHGVQCGGNGGGNGGGDKPKTEKPQLKKPTARPAAKPATAPVVEPAVVIPTRVHAGLAGTEHRQDQDGTDLSWLLVGGALVTAGGTAYVVRRKRTARATA